MFHRKVDKLYLIEILHQTTTRRCRSRRRSALYLIEILHQTTTLIIDYIGAEGCILLKFYIKPQRSVRYSLCVAVVSY